MREKANQLLLILIITLAALIFGYTIFGQKGTARNVPAPSYKKLPDTVWQNQITKGDYPLKQIKEIQ